MTHHLFRLGLLLALVLLPVTPAAQAQGTSNTIMRVAPATIQAPVGQTVGVAVEVADVQALYAADISLTFDPNAIEVVDADPNTDGTQVALGTFLDAGFIILNRADNTAGTLQFAMTQLNPSQPKNGTGAIIVVKLRGKVSGARSPLTLTKVKIVRRDGSVISTTLTSGQAQVIQAAPGPTYTPIPTQAPASPAATQRPSTVAPTVVAATQRPPTLAPTVAAATRVAAVPTRAGPVAPVETGSQLPDWILPSALIGAGLCFGVIAVIVVIAMVIIPRRRRKS